MTIERAIQEMVDAAVKSAIDKHLPRALERASLPPDADLLRTYLETAEYLGISIETVREMVKRGDLYAVGNGPARRIPHRAIQKMNERAADRASFRNNQPTAATGNTDPEVAERLGLKSKSNPPKRAA